MMDRPMNNLGFRFMSIYFRFRDYFSPPNDFKNPDSILRELVRILKPKGILAIIDHKFDKDKVVPTISHATGILKLRNTELGNGKSKETLLIFSKQEP
jgi:ubiquinone/menaquinone biosynthesis C-methylase UbiE